MKYHQTKSQKKHFPLLIQSLIGCSLVLGQSMVAHAQDDPKAALTQQVKQILTLSLPQLDGVVHSTDLKDKVSILRDENGIPTIEAQSRRDAVYALGFLHGQERFFQMDLLRRRASGELSALIGASALATDKANRAFLLRQKAEATLEHMPQERRELLKYYTAGVNAGLSHLKYPPFEYTFLGTTPSPWQEADTLLNVASLYFDLQDNEAPREYARGWIRDHSSMAQTTFLFPKANRWEVPLAGMLPPSMPIPKRQPSWWGKSSITTAQRAPEATPAAFDRAEQAKGSNGWVIQRQGVTVLANDMHLSRTLPGIWYKAALKYPDADGQSWQITGATLPGTPAVITGSNQRITWGFTNGYVDTFDWVKLSDSTPVTTQTETIKVNGGDPVSLTIHTSEFGPVQETGMGKMAMHWVINEPNAFDMTLMDLGQSNNVFDAMDIGNRSGIPVQNLLVADVDGNIAWTLAGKLPQRQFSFQNTTFPLEDNDFSRWHSGGKPAALYPRILNPFSGMIIAANNRMLYTPQGYMLGDGGFSPSFRAYSIKQALAKLDSVDVQSMYALQHDNTDYLMQDWAAWLLSCFTDAEQGNPTYQAIEQALLQWDGTADKDSVAYALLNEWRQHMYHQLFDTLDQTMAQGWSGASYSGANRRWDETVHTLMTHQRWIPAGYQNWQQFSLQLLSDVWIHTLENGKKVWGDLNQRSYGHPLAQYLKATLDLPFLNQRLTVSAVPLSGNTSVIHVNRPAFGASDQQVVRVGDDAASIYSLPNGPSGNPLSPWWFSGVDDWQNDQPQPLLPKETKHTLILEHPEQ